MSFNALRLFDVVAQIACASQLTRVRIDTVPRLHGDEAFSKSMQKHV